MKAHLRLLLILFLTGTCLSADDSTNSPLYLSWHKLCITTDTKQIDQQIHKFKTRLTNNPNDNLAKAYLGSACALRAKASFWGPTKLKYLKRGQALMNDAVNSDPANPRVRMIRAIAYYKVPTRFHCRPIAIKDFETLLPNAGNPHQLSINERQAIYYYAHLTFREAQHKDAALAKTLCHKLSPHSHYGKLTH